MRNVTFCLITAITLVTFGCGGGGGGSESVVQGDESFAYSSLAIAPGVGGCTYGGIQVDMGIDDNGNSILDPNEVDATEYVCNGAPGSDGASALITATDEASGENCEYGGQKIEIGVDSNGDTILDHLEVEVMWYECNDLDSGIPNPTPLVLGNQYDGMLNSSDIRLDDTARADFYQITMSGDDTLYADLGTLGGEAIEMHLFESNCLSNPDVSGWGQYYLGEPLDGLPLLAGDYVAIIKETPGVDVWKSLTYTGKIWSSPEFKSADGILDIDFGTGGKVVTDLSTATDQINGLALQPDGKVVAAGSARNGANMDFALVRYNSNGNIDTSFGTNGIVFTAFGTTHDHGTAVALQSDGKIVMGGYSWIGADYHVALARYNNVGVLDTTFGSGGKLTTIVGTKSTVNDIVLQPDGKIIVVGYIFIGTKQNLALIRYNSDGSMDPLFGSSGVVMTSNFYDADNAHSVALQRDGKIVVAGIQVRSGSGDFLVERFHSDGAVDSSFGSGGTVYGIFPGTGYANAIAIRPSGRILVAGRCSNSPDNGMCVGQLLPNGLMDTAFGNDGVAITPTGFFGDVATSVMIQPDGKVLAGGYEYDDVTNNFALARFTREGVLDTTFGADGVLIAGISGTNDTPYVGLIQPDGKIILGGHSDNGANFDFALERIK